MESHILWIFSNTGRVVTGHAQRTQNLTMDVSFVWSNKAVLIKVACWKCKGNKIKENTEEEQKEKQISKIQRKEQGSKENKHQQQTNQGNLEPLRGIIASSSCWRPILSTCDSHHPRGSLCMGWQEREQKSGYLGFIPLGAAKWLSLLRNRSCFIKKDYVLLWYKTTRHLSAGVKL